jgi:hypothetical protein
MMLPFVGGDGWYGISLDRPLLAGQVMPQTIICSPSRRMISLPLKMLGAAPGTRRLATPADLQMLPRPYPYPSDRRRDFQRAMLRPEVATPTTPTLLNNLTSS